MKVKGELRNGKWAGGGVQEERTAWTMMMRWETAWHVWGMAGGQGEEDGARKFPLGPDGQPGQRVWILSC